MTTEEIKNEVNEKEKNESNENDNINKGDNNLDLKELFFSHPSQKDKKKKDFTEYSRIDMKLLNKKRERENKKEENKDDENNNKLEEDKNDNAQEEKKDENENEEAEEKKDNSIENNLPGELVDLINQTKSNEPFTVEDFEKYRAYKKININVYNK